MLKYVVRDYFRAFKWGNIKETWRATSQTSFTIFLVIWLELVEVNCGLGDIREQIVYTCALYLPIAFAWFSAVIHPVQLTKMMYLCPVSKEERSRYVKQSYYFRIMFHMLIVVAGMMICILFSRWDGIAVLAILLNDLAFCQLLPSGEQADRNEKGIYTSHEWEICLKLFLAFTVDIFTVVWVEFLFDHEVSNLVKLVLLLLMLCFEIPMTRANLKYVRRDLRAAAEYENNL